MMERGDFPVLSHLPALGAGEYLVQGYVLGRVACVLSFDVLQQVCPKPRLLVLRALVRPL
jgi:hypothetical protein